MATKPVPPQKTLFDHAEIHSPSVLRKIVIPYAVVSVLWILLSDHLLSMFFVDPAQIELVSILKGWAFIAVTSVLLLILVRRYTALLGQQNARIQEMQSEKLRGLIFLKAIADATPDAVFAKDNQGRYLFFNECASQLTGKQVKDVIGHTDQELFPPETCEWTLEGDAQALAANAIGCFEKTLSSPHNPITLLVTKGPLRNADGEFQGVFGVAHDISVRKEMENALRDSEERLRIIMDATQTGLWDWDIRKDRWSASAQYYTMLGYEPVIGASDRIAWLERAQRNAAHDLFELVLEDVAEDVDHRHRLGRL